MDEKIICPLCGSPKTENEKGMIRVKLFPLTPGEPAEEKVLTLYRCLDCGRMFDEEEAKHRL